MFTFPESVSRIVFQYPATKQVNFLSQVVRFVGGGEQRYGLNTALHQWNVEPAILSDSALQEVAEFFEVVGGTANPFKFVDPWDGTVYPVCYFGSDNLTSEFRDTGRNSLAFTILEGRLQV